MFRCENMGPSLRRPLPDGVVKRQVGPSRKFDIGRGYFFLHFVYEVLRTIYMVFFCASQSSPKVYTGYSNTKPLYAICCHMLQ